MFEAINPVFPSVVCVFVCVCTYRTVQFAFQMQLLHWMIIDGVVVSWLPGCTTCLVNQPPFPRVITSYKRVPSPSILPKTKKKYLYVRHAHHTRFAQNSVEIENLFFSVRFAKQRGLALG